MMPTPDGRCPKLEGPDPASDTRSAHQHFGGGHADSATGLRLHHNHGSQFTSGNFQNEIRSPGIESSPAFVREPEGNGCIERFFMTLKEQLLRERYSHSIPELVQALQQFRVLYTESWLIERPGFESPAQARHRLANEAAAWPW